MINNDLLFFIARIAIGNALEVITVTETDRLVRVCPLQKE